MAQHHAPRRRLGALLATAALVLAACGGDDDGNGDDAVTGEPDEFGVTLVHAGDDSDDVDRVTLPPPYQEGQQATTDLDMLVEIDLDADAMSQSVSAGMLIVMVEEVVDVTDDIATVEGRIESIELTDESDLGPDALAELDHLIGEVVVAQYGPTGQQLGPMELASGEPMPDDLDDMFDSTDVFAFPSEPISTGARWSTIEDTDLDVGVMVQMETVYELVELTDDHFVLELTQEIPVDERVDGARMTGQYIGSGTITGSRDNPLMLDMTYEQNGDFTISEGSEEVGMSMRITLEMTGR